MELACNVEVIETSKNIYKKPSILKFSVLNKNTSYPETELEATSINKYTMN